MIPEVVVFDLGKVLVDFDFGVAARKIAARGTVSTDQVQEIIQNSPALVRYESGRITRRAFFEEVQRLTGFRGSVEEFGQLFADIFRPIEPMIALHARLRRQRTPCFIFSNTNDLAISHIRQSYPFFADFDGYVLSYEHGVMKPAPGLYEVVERVTGRADAGILYLDDRLENVQAGAARGWQVIHHQTAEETLPAFRRLGLTA